jgi:hypothetical protein
MKEISKSKYQKWWIAHGNSGTVRYGELKSGNALVTGQPNLEEFTVRGEWKARLKILGVNVDNDRSSPPL